MSPQKNIQLTNNAAGQCPVANPGLFFQPKLSINQPNDIFEQEADAVADTVMRRKDISSLQKESFFKPAITPIQRKCAHCEEEEKKEKIQRKETMDTVPAMDGPAENYVSNLSGGSRMDDEEKQFFESRMGRDFSGVRLHTDTEAAKSAASINALAYAHENNIVFGIGQYQPGTENGKRLMAHELTHVVQQKAAGASTTVQRQNTTASAQALSIANILINPRISIFPTGIQHAQYGNVGVLQGSGGFAGDGISRLNAVIGEGTTMTELASYLLPFFVNATPDTTPGTGIISTPPTLDELAQAMLVYNFYYYGGDSMSEWKAGLRVPLPLVLDTTTQTLTVNTSFIQALASGFDPQYAPLLIQASAANNIPEHAITQAETDLEHQRARDFAALFPDLEVRGIQLLAAAKRNPVEAASVFHGLYAVTSQDEVFRTGLAFGENAVNSDLDIIAAQERGHSIIFYLEDSVTSMAPATPTPEQQQGITRILLMVTGANNRHPQAEASMPGPETTCANGIHTETVDVIKLHGSTRNIIADFADANRIFEQCCVIFQIGNIFEVDDVTTQQWIGTNEILHTTGLCGSLSGEERNMYRGAQALFHPSSEIKAYYIQDSDRAGAGGWAFTDECGPHALARRSIVVLNTGGTNVLAHELGHITRNRGHVGDIDNLMHRSGSGNALTPAQCRIIFSRTD